MADVIRLLPDSVANQIAAGEVVQRPASVVKELLENAVDAGASEIRLVVQEGGHTLIQVTDNGCGMSPIDARMSFERHATSKIKEANDLFAIRTMGFRGEALASIASVAWVELKTKRDADELGTRILIEGSKLMTQEELATVSGTTFAVKNLFYNIPARKNFLKAPAIEFRHILDEFLRVAIPNPDIFMSLTHNGKEMYHLPSGNLRQRIVGVFGKNYNDKLVPIQETTDVLKISGFVGKPDFTKKTRGEQYFFVNKRFIKSPYLHIAVMQAFEDLIPKDAFPFYILSLEIDPSQVDVNVHPTKQEIKFEDDRLIFQLLKASVRHGLGQHQITPVLDFDQDANFESSFQPRSTFERLSDKPQQSVSSFSSSFDRTPSKPSSNQNLRNWERLYEGMKQMPAEQPPVMPEDFDEPKTQTEVEPLFRKEERLPYQIHNTYIISPIKSGFMLLSQQAASERILYEQYLQKLYNQPVVVQRQLFPKQIELPTADAEVLRTILSEIKLLGIEVQETAENQFAIIGVPAESKGELNEKTLLENLISQFKNNVDIALDIKENVARSMAKTTAIKSGKSLSTLEMQNLIDQLFACEVPYSSPSGQLCFISYSLEEIKERLSGE